MRPIASAPDHIAGPRIRVGLQTDADEATFPRLDGGYIVVTDAGSSAIRRGITVRAPRAGQPVRWGVRVATFQTSEAAETEATRVRGMVDAPVNVIQDAAGRWRVMVGDFESSAAGEPVRDALLLNNYPPPLYIVRRPATDAVEHRLSLEDDEGARHSIAGRSILIHPATADRMTIAGKEYRGGARLWINDRGLINVINEVSLENYVRGVVPGELGPRTYDELEAQKAQALAARTYAVRRFGEFASEGYDICPTAACQVYSGISIEEALSDQAIEATAGLVIAWEEEPIDALFTSTCGGETSDVSTMFPGRDEPYLKSVECVELETTNLSGQRDGKAMTEAEAEAGIFATTAKLPVEGFWGSQDAVKAVAAANRMIGFSPSRSVAAPDSTRRGDLLDYLARMWDLGELGRALTMPEDRAYFFEASADAPTSPTQAFLIKFGVLPAQIFQQRELNETMPREEFYSLLYSWVREVGAASETTGRIASVNGSTIAVKTSAGTRTFALAANTPLFRRFHGTHREERSVPALVGDRIRIIHDRSDKPLAVVVEANYDGATFDRTSAFANWTRSYRADQLVTSIAKRVPITALRDLRPLEIDEAGRVKRMEVLAEGERIFNLEGIQIRFALDLPDNLFLIRRGRDADGVARFTFFGKGWGHGTGMCQTGAFGMAVRGRTAEQIVGHYYTGTRVVPLTTLSGVPQSASEREGGE